MVERVRMASKPKKQTRPKHGRKPHSNTKKHEYYTIDQVKEALEACGGIKSRAARYLQQKTGRGSGATNLVINYIRRHPELEDFLKEVEEGVIDLAESKLLRAIRRNSHPSHMRAVMFYLRTKGKRRGYTTRTELTGAQGRPLGDTYLDLSRLTDEELNHLERLYAKAAVEESGPDAPQSGNGFDPEGESGPQPQRVQ